MIKSLFIKNFKNIEELNLRTFGKVNLFTGRNNTGKSTLLEAIALHVNGADISTLSNILEDRGEFITRELREIKSSEDYMKYNTKAISSLFFDRSFDKVITIQPNDSIDYYELQIRFVNYKLVKKIIEGEEILKKQISDQDTTNTSNSELLLGLEIRTGKSSYLIPLNDNIRLVTRLKYNAPKGALFIKSGQDKRLNTGSLWDSITLTEKETYVIEALKIIEPSIERIAFVNELSQRRTAVVKLKNKKQVFPIKSMGDGINRILSIILAAVNAENGYLLIDEFENGLHHSVQEKLWEIIFKLAEELNIQVFATTHSNDCIYGFESVLNGLKEKISSGKLIRLEKKGEQIQEVSFDENELRIATNEDIEIR